MMFQQATTDKKITIRSNNNNNNRFSSAFKPKQKCYRIFITESRKMVCIVYGSTIIR